MPHDPVLSRRKEQDDDGQGPQGKDWTDRAGNELHGDLTGFYEIKLHRDRYCLVYQVVEQRIVIFVVAVGRREDNEIYTAGTWRVLETPADRTEPFNGKSRKR